MVASELSDLRQVIQATIESVDQLRILLLVRDSPEKSWTPQDVSVELHLALAVAEAGLSKLAARGFLMVLADQSSNYRYSPVTSDQRKLVDSLAQFDRERPVSLVNLIYSVNAAKRRR